MKKIFYLASIAALALSSCTKDETTQAALDVVKGGSKIMAKAEGDATRTHLEAVNGNYEFRWSENDVIGVYGNGANSAKNVPFTLLDSYSDQAEGVFESNYQLLAGDNFFAYYPQVPGNDYAPVWVKASGSGANAVAAHWNLNDFKMKISKDQNYKPGSFNTVTAPAVSTAFTMDEDGNADVTMQPVGDYLFVNLAGVEDIQTVTLELWAAKRGEETGTTTGAWKYIGTNKDIADRFAKIEGSYINQPYNSPYDYFKTENRSSQGGGNYGGGNYGGGNDSPSYTYETDVKDWEYRVDTKVDYEYSSPEAIQIAGNGTLKEYTYIDAEENVSTRYYLSNDGMEGGNSITLSAGQLTDVVCHEPNVYVFVVPGGILGMNPTYNEPKNKEVVAKVYVNRGIEGYQAIKDQTYFEFGGTALNGGPDAKGNKIWRTKDADGNYTMKMENTVFWANAKVAGVRETALYNPENDFIIYNEIDFLQYMNEYGKNTAVASRNAYVCAEHVFDFSDENMRALAAQIVKTDNSEATTALRRYIDDYVANGVPCVDEYTSKFKGNGATFHALKKLQSEDGLFGEMNGAVIKEITFEGIVAPEYTTKIQATDQYDRPLFDNLGNEIWLTSQGFVLGAPDTATKFDKVGVVGADAIAITSEGTVAQYEGLVLSDVDALAYIFGQLNMEKDLTFKNWDVASTVAANVFAEITAATGKENDKHHVVTIAAGDADEYAKLAGDIAIYRGGAQAVSVVIEGVSYWTGSTVNTAAIPAVKNAYVNTIAYAEQLAYGKGNLGASSIATIPGTYAAMTRDMDANYENIEITWPNEVDYSGVVFSGAEFAVKGIVLNTAVSVKQNSNPAFFNVAPETLAPFKFTSVSDLTLDGVEINIQTSNTATVSVPAKVAGLSITAAQVSNVAIEGLNIDTFEVSNTLNHDAYYGNVVPVIGWLVAEAQNLQIEDSSADVAYSSLEGRAALVGQVTVTDTDSFFNGCSVSYGDLNDQEAIADFTKYNAAKNKNVYGTMVAHVINTDTKAHGIKFYNSGKPVFLYSISSGAINVYYDNETKVLNK